jgi:hypothetical protein
VFLERQRLLSVVAAVQNAPNETAVLGRTADGVRRRSPAASAKLPRSMARRRRHLGEPIHDWCLQFTAEVPPSRLIRKAEPSV